MKALDNKCGERNVYKRLKYTASTTETQEESTGRQGLRDKEKKRGKEQTEQEQIRHEVGEGTSEKKYTKPVENRVDT